MANSMTGYGRCQMLFENMDWLVEGAEVYNEEN